MPVTFHIPSDPEYSNSLDKLTREVEVSVLLRMLRDRTCYESGGFDDVAVL